MLYRKSKSRDDHTVIPALKLFLIILPGHLGCIGGQVVHDEPERSAHANGALHTKAEAVLLEDGLLLRCCKIKGRRPVRWRAGRS